MSFRKEDKLLINPYQIFDFKCWLVNNDAKQIFPARFINSLYFDNLLSQMFLDSEEGCVPRKKIRIRTYPKQEENKKINLEIKISSVEGRYKETNEINNRKKNFYIKKGYFDKQYGICFPKLNVSYLREYYLVFGIRVTIDTNIIYKKFKSDALFLRDEENIVEIKSNNSTPSDFLLNKFPLQKSRFSKYSRAHNKLY